MFQLDPRYRWYKITLKDENHQLCDYYLRGLTAKERRIASSKGSSFDAETYFLEQAVHPQKDWLNMLAGVSMTLLKEIYRCSGLTEEQATFQEAIDWIQDENGAMEAVAVAMIPSCSLDTLENCDPFQYAKYLLMGKFQFESMYGIPVEQAFLPREQVANDIDFSPRPGPPAMPGYGEVGQQIENQFSWKRGQ